MTLSYRNILLASVAAIALPVAASAATMPFDIDANQNYTFVTNIAPGDSTNFQFTALSNFFVDDISVAGTGTNSGLDVAAVRFQSSAFPGITVPFDETESRGNVGLGFGFQPGFSVMAGDVVNLFIDGAFTNAVGVSLSFTTQTTPVPLPAAGGLLALALGGLGVAGARKKKTA